MSGREGFNALLPLRQPPADHLAVPAGGTLKGRSKRMSYGIVHIITEKAVEIRYQVIDISTDRELQIFDTEPEAEAHIGRLVQADAEEAMAEAGFTLLPDGKSWRKEP